MPSTCTCLILPVHHPPSVTPTTARYALDCAEDDRMRGPYHVHAAVIPASRPFAHTNTAPGRAQRHHISPIAAYLPISALSPLLSRQKSTPTKTQTSGRKKEQGPGIIEMRHERLLPALPVIPEVGTGLSLQEGLGNLGIQYGGVGIGVSDNDHSDNNDSNDNNDRNQHRDQNDGTCHSQDIIRTSTRKDAYRSQRRQSESHQLTPAAGDRFRYFGHSLSSSAAPSAHPSIAQSTSRRRSAHSTLQAALDLPTPTSNRAPGRVQARAATADIDKPLPPPPPRSSSLTLSDRRASSSGVGRASRPPITRRGPVPQPIPVPAPVSQSAPESVSVPVRRHRVAVPGSPTCPELIISDYDYDFHCHVQNQFRYHHGRTSGLDRDTDEIDSAASTPLQTPDLPESEYLPDSVRIVNPSSDNRNPRNTAGEYRSRYPSTNDSDDSTGSDDFAVIRYAKDPESVRKRIAALAGQQRSIVYPEIGTALPAPKSRDLESVVPNARRILAPGPISRPLSVIRKSHRSLSSSRSPDNPSPYYSCSYSALIRLGSDVEPDGLVPIRIMATKVC